MTDYIPTIIGALGAIAGGAATQYFTLWRESHSGNKARFRDMQFIGGELTLRLRGLTLNGTKTHVKQCFLPLTPLLMAADVLLSPVLPV